MFPRREKQPLFGRIREFFWPSAGFKRSTHYVFHRVARIPGSPYSIAAGFACGAAVSFTPFVGLHFILSAMLAWVLRANIIASAIGTAVGNPWTFPFIWVWIYKAGNLVVGEGPAQAGQMDLGSVLFDAMEALWRFDLTTLADTGGPVFWTMLVGSLPSGLLVWILFYIALQPLVKRYQINRVHRRQKKTHARMLAEQEAQE